MQLLTEGLGCAECVKLPSTWTIHLSTSTNLHLIFKQPRRTRSQSEPQHNSQISFPSAHIPLCSLLFQSCQPHDLQLSETYQKMSEMEVSKNETCLWKIKCCGSSTVTINKQKHIHKKYTVVNIFSSGCYAPYIYIYIYIYNSCTTSLSQASPVFDLLLFRSARPFYTLNHDACNCIRNILHAWRVRSRL